jgi:hypothetical protein
MAEGVVVPKEIAALGYQQLQLRKQIAMKMMLQKARRPPAPPQNVGQGLAVAGDPVADMSMMQMLAQQQEEERIRAEKALTDAAAARGSG